MTEKTQDFLSRVDTLLDETKSSREHASQADILLVDMGDFDEVNAVWDGWVPVVADKQNWQITAFWSKSS